jgi:hypothetical protein
MQMLLRSALPSWESEQNNRINSAHHAVETESNTEPDDRSFHNSRSRALSSSVLEVAKSLLPFFNEVFDLRRTRTRICSDTLVIKTPASQ